MLHGLIQRVSQRLLVVGVAGLLSLNLQAQVMIPAPPQLAATSWILMDAHSGRILAEHNADERLAPASLTKMMTSYLLEYEIKQGNVSLDEMVTVSEKAWRMPGSRMFIEVGTQVSVEDLLRGVIIQSGNDASVAVAEHLAGSESAFADLMNQHARQMGMMNSNFTNSSGLPDPNLYSTARDMAILSRVKILEYPEHYSMYSEREFTYNNIRQSNRNRLLWRDASVDGLKTGHTTEAGYCLAASAVRNDMRLISVVMGARSDEGRTQESQKLLSYGFRYYETLLLQEAFSLIDQPRIWQGVRDQLRVGLDSDLHVTLPRGHSERIQTEILYDSTLKAPISTGQVLGQFRVMLDGEVLAETPLRALESVEQAGFFKRLWHSLVMFVTGLFS